MRWEGASRAADGSPQHDSDSHPVSSRRAGFRPALCVKSWSNLNGKAGRKLPQFSQVQYGRNKFVGSPDCNQLYYQIKSAVILCTTRDGSLFFVSVCSPSLQKYPPGCHRVCDHGNRRVHAHQCLLLHSPGNTRCSGFSCCGCGELSLLLLSPQCGQLMLWSWQVFQRWFSCKCFIFS